MRCEKPWSASVGATKKMRARASVTSTSEDVASPGSDIRYVRPTAASVAGPCRTTAGEPLFRDDVLECRPAQEREDGVIETEEAEIAARVADDARADAADHDRNGERQEEERQEEIARPGDDGHGADERADGADAEIGESHACHGRDAQAVEEEREHRQRDSLGGDEERERGERLSKPDRAAVAGCEHEPVEHVLLTLGNERTSEAEQGGEDDRNPEQTARREPRRSRGKREVEHDERRDDEDQHGRKRVARAQLEQEILARECAHVGQIVHAASATRTVASESMRAGSCVETRIVRSPCNSANCASSSSAPCVSSAAYGSSRISKAGSCSSVRQSASRCVMPREYDDTRSARASQSPNRSSSMPIRSRRSGTR